MDKAALIAIGLVIVIVAAIAVTQLDLLGGESVSTPEEAADTTEDISSLATDISGDLEDLEQSLG